MGNAASNQLPNFPPELLVEVFNFACDDYRTHVHEAIADVRRPHCFIMDETRTITSPVTLSQVCRQWKDYVYRTPVLWDTVFVYVPTGHPDTTYDESAISNMTMKLTRWLDRSKCYPVTVKINAPRLVHEPLLDCPERWKNIDILCLACHSGLYPKLEKILKGPLPLLESFISRPSSHCDRKEDHPTLSLHAANKLTRITRFNDLPLSFPQSGIDICRWDGCSTSNIINDLKCMDKIRDCTVYNPDHVGIATLLSSPLSLLHLEDLKLELLTKNCYMHLLPSLELPALRRFTFSNWRSLAYTRNSEVLNLLPILLSFLQRSSSPYLQTLDLRAFVRPVHADVILDILRSTPTLTHLSLYLSGYYSHGLTTIAMSQPSVIPEVVVLHNLTSYDLHMKGLEHDNDQNAALLKYLTLPALKELRVSFPREPSKKSQVTFLEVLSLVNRSGCSLTILHLTTEAYVSQKVFLNLLKQLPTLECLTVVGRNYYIGRRLSQKSTAEVRFLMTRKYFEFLMPQSNSSVYLPRLRELSLEGRITATGNEVLDALEYRWNGDNNGVIQRLLHVRLYTPDFIKPNDETSFRRYESLRAQGMDLVFGKPPS